MSLVNRACRRVLGAAVLMLLCAPQLGAQTTSSERDAAEALFQQGKSLMSAGKYPEACEKFEASQSLEAGLATELFLGDCREKAGNTASAWRSFKKAIASAQRLNSDPRGSLARIRAAALEPQLATLRLRLAPVTRGLAGLSVTLNGTPVEEADYDSAIPVDPGRIDLQVTAPGHARWGQSVEIRRGPSRAIVDVPELSRFQPVESAVAAAPGSPRPNLSREVPKMAAGRVLRLAGLLLGSAGAVSAGVGALFGLRAIREANDSRLAANCPLDDRCYPRGLALREGARDDAHLADIAFGVGGALLLSGAVLYLLAPDTYNFNLAPAAGGAKLALEAVW